MNRYLQESNIPEWDALLQAARVGVTKEVAPVTVISSDNISGDLIVLRGSQFIYLAEDPSRGYYIRSIFGDSLAFILSHFMKHDITTEISLSPHYGTHYILSIFGTKNGSWSWHMDLGMVNFNWDKFLNVVVKLQQRVKRLLLRRLIGRTGVQHNLFKYKKASAFMSSLFAQQMQYDMVNLILHEFIDSHDFKKDSPIPRIQTNPFKKIRNVESETLVSEHVN